MPAEFADSKSSKKDRSNLYLVGFMGTGKSTVGYRVAQMLGMPFLDSDHEIEKRAGMKVAEIFENLGEPRFREMESQFVDQWQPRSGNVISCGGGLVTNKSLLNKIQQMGVVVVLYASIDTLEKRLSRDQNRPLMQVENPKQRIEELLEERRPIYQNAGVGIMTDGHTSQEVADHVIRIYLDKINS